MPAYPSPVLYKSGQSYVPVPVGPPVMIPGGGISGQGSPFVGAPLPPIGGPGNFNPPYTPPVGVPGPPSTGGGGVGGWVGDAVGWVEDLLEGFGFTWEDVGEWLEPLVGGGNGTEGGASTDQKVRAVEEAFQNAGLRQAFISFLQNAGAAISWINSFINNPIPSWPVFLIDLVVFWLKRGAPATAGQSGFQESAGMLQSGGFTGGSTLPTPMNGFELLAGTALVNPVLQATPTMVYKAPKGYVTVTHPTTGAKLFVEKTLAYRAGLVKRRKRAPFTARQWNSLKEAARVEEKVKRMASRSFSKYKCVRK